MPDLSLQTSAHQLSSKTLSSFIREGEVASGHGVTSPSTAVPARQRCVLRPTAAWRGLGRVLPHRPCMLRVPTACSPVSPSLLRCQPSEKLGLMQCRQWKQAAASVSLLGLSWWKSIRLNFNSFSVSVLVPSKGHSYLSINSALCCKIGIQRLVLNFFHPLLLLCLCGACSQLSIYPPQIPS